MHILFVVNALDYFRAHRERLAVDLTARGHTVTVAAGNIEEAPLDGWPQNIRLVPLELDKHSFRPLHDLKLIWHIRRLMAEEQPQVVHCFTIKPILMAGLAFALRSRRTAGSLVWTFAGLGKVFDNPKTPYLKFRKWLVAQSLKMISVFNGAHATFENQADRDSLVAAGVIPDNRAKAIMGTGIDLEHYRLPDFEHGADHEQASDVPLTFLMATRLIGEKGVDNFLKVAAQCKANGAAARFVLAGMADHANPDVISQDVIDEAVDAGTIEFAGAVSQADMPALLGSADIFCLPTRLREGFPRALLEAASCGVALIATDQLPMRTLIKPGQTGWLVNPPDAAHLQEAVDRALDDPVATRQMGKNARTLVEQLPVDCDSVTDGFLQAYQQAQGRKVHG